LDPGQSVYFNNYGAALKRLERHVEALAFFHRAVAICPQYIDALSNLEKAYEELERFDSGVKERSSPAQLSTRPPDGQYTSKLYARALYTPSDIYEHVATLRLLATQCRAVTEFGVRSGVSTAALLAGIVGRQGTRLTSYDIVRCEEVDELEAAGGCAFKFILGNSCDVEIEKTDLLFIDTYHSGNQLWEELTRHHRSVKRWIVLHDTVVFGVTGENGEPGLMLAVRRFLAEFPQWSIVAEYRNNNGLTILGNMNP